MLPKKGKVLRDGNDRKNRESGYAAMIATALRAELGDTHRATKTVMRWTGASERAATHWLAGRHGPNGAYLIVLLAESDTVFEAVLSAAGRRDTVVAARVLAAHGTMVELTTMLEQQRSRPLPAGRGFAGSDGDQTSERADDPKSDRINDPESDRAAYASHDGLNPRQRWFIEMLASGQDVRAISLLRRWGVSDKTARRDVAVLKGRGLIEFVGPYRSGRYRLTS